MVEEEERKQKLKNSWKNLQNQFQFSFIFQMDRLLLSATFFSLLLNFSLFSGGFFY